MKRRDIIAGIAGGALGARAAGAQQPAVKVPRVGFLIAGDPEPSWGLYRKSMAELGYVDGRNIAFDYRNASPASGQLAVHAAELVKAEVNVIVAVLTPAILAAKQATTKIPIVFNGGVPETGTVTNLARPEGNLTGLYGATSIIAGKSIQLFREIKPTTKSVGVLLNAPDPFNVPLRREIEAAGRASQVEIVSIMIKAREEIAPAFEDLARRGIDGVIVQPSLPLKETADLAIKHRLASLSFRREFAQIGGLMSYGADQVEQYRLLASYTDKVLKGTPTSDLPIQMSTRFELIVNQKTAQAMGLAVSPMFLGRADEVIE